MTQCGEKCNWDISRVQDRQPDLTTDRLVDPLVLCAAHRPSSLGPSALVALSAARAVFCHARAAVPAVPAGPCGPKKTREIPVGVCPDNQKPNFVNADFFWRGQKFYFTTTCITKLGLQQC